MLRVRQHTYRPMLVEGRDANQSVSIGGEGMFLFPRAFPVLDFDVGTGYHQN